MTVEALVDARLVFRHDREIGLKPYADGFELQVLFHDESAASRYWPLDAGWIEATGENELTVLRAVGAESAAPIDPPTGPVEPIVGDLELTMPWPGVCETRTFTGPDANTYELRWPLVTPERWFQVGPVVIGVGSGAELASVTTTAPRPPRTWAPVVLRAGGHIAILQRTWFSAGRDSEDDLAEGLESATGNAWLSRDADDTMTDVDIHDVTSGTAVAFDANAAETDALNLWQRWPLPVVATRWADGERTLVGVSFGDEEPEAWARLRGERVWAGYSAQGELQRLVFGDVEEGVARRYRLGSELDEEGEPIGDLRFDLYGLAGRLGAPGGESSRRGIPWSLGLTFGDPEGSGDWVVVRSTRETDLDRALRDVGAGAPLDPGWRPVTISVDGRPSEFRSTSHGRRALAVGRVGRTTIVVDAQDHQLTQLKLERVSDIAPHIDYQRALTRDRIAAAMTPEGKLSLAREARQSPEQRARRAAAEELVDDLLDDLSNRARAKLAERFTTAVTDGWGGPDRYARLLWLHTMLRPIDGWSGGTPPELSPDGTATVRVSPRHIHPRGNVVSMVLGADDEPTDSNAVDFRVVADGDSWRIDTDLLQILVDRVGTVQEVSRPLSQQHWPR